MGLVADATKTFLSALDAAYTCNISLAASQDRTGFDKGNDNDLLPEDWDGLELRKENEFEDYIHRPEDLTWAPKTNKVGWLWHIEEKASAHEMMQILDQRNTLEEAFEALFVALGTVAPILSGPHASLSVDLFQSGKQHGSMLLCLNHIVVNIDQKPTESDLSKRYATLPAHLEKLADSLRVLDPADAYFYYQSDHFPLPAANAGQASYFHYIVREKPSEWKLWRKNLTPCWPAMRVRDLKAQTDDLAKRVNSPRHK